MRWSTHIGRAVITAALVIGAVAVPGCGASDGRDAKMDEIDRHVEAIDALVKAIPDVPPEAGREKALAAKVHMDAIWEVVEFLKGSFQKYPPDKKQARRFSELKEKIGAASDKTVAALKRTQR